jgi:hypothetical protein
LATVACALSPNAEVPGEVAWELFPIAIESLAIALWPMAMAPTPVAWAL